MTLESTGVIGYPDSRYYGSNAPAQAPYVKPAARPRGINVEREHSGTRERSKTAVAQYVPTVSLFAVFGAVLAGVLMIFVVLAQISYDEIAAETVKLNSQLNSLVEQERRLEIQFESVIDMKEIEMYAKDTLGMSKPETESVVLIRTMPIDHAVIIAADSDGGGTMSDLGSFISSLFEYFR